MDLLVGVVGHDRVHEGEELDPPAPLGVLGLDLAGRDVERGEQGAVAVPLVFVRLAVERAAVGQLEVALRPLQGLDRRLLVDREHDRVLGRREVEPDDGGGLGGELGVARQAPGLAPGEVDPLGAQKAPDVLVADVAEFCGEQRRGPTGEARGRRPVEQRQMRRSASSP